jgi:hypothetical protein
LRPTIERVASPARLDFNKLAGDFKPLVAREPRQRLALRLDAKAGTRFSFIRDPF